MFIDSRQIAAETHLDTSVCIVGGGPAGLTLAMELAGAGIPVSVFESGPLRLHGPTARLNEGESNGLPYEYSHGQRSRYLGGDSNRWGGYCRPWDPWDFEKRDWLPDSGWPVNFDTLQPYYRRANSLLKVGSDNFDPEFWHAGSEQSLKRLSLDPERIREIVTLFSPPLNFNREFSDLLTKSELITVYLRANAVHVDTDPLSGNVSRIEFTTLRGNRFFAGARQYVLAAGGIENIRILLNSNREHPTGLGNQNDMVGRYFMDHPRLMSGEVKLTPNYRDLSFYDSKYFFKHVRVNGIRVAGQFTIPFEIQRREGLMNSQMWIRSLYPGETTDAVQSLRRMRLRLARRYSLSHGLGHDLLTMARHPLQVGRFAASFAIGSRSMVGKVAMEAIVEPEPTADSRVTLSETRDSIGLRRAQVDWRLTDRCKRTFDRGFELLGEQLRVGGIAELIPGEPFEGRPWPRDRKSVV